MKPLLTKEEILGWHEEAVGVLNLRRAGKHPRGKLSESDYQAYSRSIEAYFKQLKRAFNKRLKDAASS